MKVKNLVLTLVALFLIAYVSFGVWIAHDTKVILERAMQPESDYSEYMNTIAYKKINPVERKMTAESFVYDKKNHDIGFVFPVHFFFVSKSFVTQRYSTDNLAFKEPVSLTLKLNSGKWYATNAQIKP
jgi:hypothetical protein